MRQGEKPETQQEFVDVRAAASLCFQPREAVRADANTSPAGPCQHPAAQDPWPRPVGVLGPFAPVEL